MLIQLGLFNGTHNNQQESICIRHTIEKQAEKECKGGKRWHAYGKCREIETLNRNWLIS